MSKHYHIYAYKHYWPEGGISEFDVPMPYTMDSREYVIEATSEKKTTQNAEIRESR